MLTDGEVIIHNYFIESKIITVKASFVPVNFWLLILYRLLVMQMCFLSLSE